MPRNMRSFDVSSGGFSGAVVVVVVSDSDAIEGAVEAGESWKDPDEAEAILCYSKDVLQNRSLFVCLSFRLANLLRFR